MVLQTLINVYRIEATVLVHSREDGERLMRRYPDKIAACFDDTGRQVGHRGGGHFNTAKYSTQDRGCAQLCTKKTGKDRLPELRQAYHQCEGKLASARREVVQYTTELNRERSRYEEIGKRLLAISSETREARVKQEAMETILKDFEDSAADETCNSIAAVYRYSFR